MGQRNFSTQEQRSSATPEVGEKEEDKGESGKEEAQENGKDQASDLSVLGNKFIQNAARERTVLRKPFVERIANEKERLKDKEESDKLKQVPVESSSGATENIGGSKDEEGNTEEDLKPSIVESHQTGKERLKVEGESDKLKQTSESSSGLTDNTERSYANKDEFSEGSPSSSPSDGSDGSDGSPSPSPSDGRPRSLGTAVDHPPLKAKPGITVKDEENSLEPGDEETKEDAKKTRKKKKNTSVSALPDKSGRCDHLTDENLILRCKVIACFRNVAHCYN